MRVLVADDASAGAEIAVALADSISWPAGSVVRVVSAMDLMFVAHVAPWPAGGYMASPELETAAVEHLEAELAATLDRLKAPGRTIEGVVMRARPATAIVDAAREFEADLVIVGSRGHGAVASLVLGSVSAEVVDRAPCPVLVARVPTVSRVLFATDGSETARAAETAMLGWPFLDGIQVRVVSVGQVIQPWQAGIAPTMYPQIVEAHVRDLEAARAESGRIAHESAGRLREAGRQAEVDVRTGDPAAEIVSSAQDYQADLIVVGSRGATGLKRIVLGSVARNVLLGGRVSVLIVRSQNDR